MGLFGNSKERSRKKAAQHYETGLDYYEGRNKPKSMVHAMSNFRLAAEKDNVDACRALGWIYLYEEDFGHNVNEAVRWYEKGAKLDDVQCLCNLAAVFVNEESVQDYERAYSLFARASELGSGEACFYRAQFLQQGLGTEQNTAQAKHWYQRAYEEGNREAAEELAVLWESETVALDAESETDCREAAGLLDQAADWHEKAAETAQEDEILAERRQRAVDCRRAAEDYRRRAEVIRAEIQSAWLSAPEPRQAYCIVLCADYEPEGRRVMTALKRYVGSRFGYTEGAREEYAFFWFEDGGQPVEVTCYEKQARMLELLQQGELPLSRMIPLISEAEGVSETLRLCIEKCWQLGCYSILPLFVTDAEESELGRFIERDAEAFGRATGARAGSTLYRVTGEVSLEEVWCPAVLDPEVTWWQEDTATPVEVMMAPVHLPEPSEEPELSAEEAETQLSPHTESEAAEQISHLEKEVSEAMDEEKAEPVILESEEARPDEISEEILEGTGAEDES